MSVAIRQFINSVNDKRVANALNGMLDRMLPTKLDTAITAKAGGVQADATPLNPDASFHDVTVVVTAADAIALPPARVGQFHFVKNSDSAQAMQVFAPTPDTIDGVATATGVSQLAGDAVLYVCLVDGNYIRLGGLSVNEVFTGITATSAHLGSLNATTVGAATASTGAFTSLSASATAAFGSTSASTEGHYGVAPVAQASAIATALTTGAIATTGVGYASTAQLQAHVDATNAIIVALRNIGITL